MYVSWHTADAGPGNASVAFSRPPHSADSAGSKDGKLAKHPFTSDLEQSRNRTFPGNVDKRGRSLIQEWSNSSETDALAA